MHVPSVPDSCNLQLEEPIDSADLEVTLVVVVVPVGLERKNIVYGDSDDQVHVLLVRVELVQRSCSRQSSAIRKNELPWRWS